MLKSKLFWYGILVSPIIWLAILCIAGFSFRQLKAIREWYFGLPIVQWPAMWLVVMGCKVLKIKKYCHFMTYDGRFWLSPNVKGFKIPSDAAEITPR